MADAAADHQADSGAAPDVADAGRTAVEDQLAEETEQNLRRAAAGGPADADQSDAQDQRIGTHVAQALDILMPRASDFGFSERRLAGLKRVALHAQA